MKAINKHGVEFTLSPEEEIPFLADQAKAEADQAEYEAGAMDRALEEKHTKIDEMRDKMIARGFVYDFPDKAGTIQVRDKKDQDSITGVATGGLANIALGDLEAQNFFMDKENHLHPLTNEQAIAMGQGLKGWIESHYQAAWVHKASLKDVEGEAVKTVEDIQAYDISVGWPE